MNEALAIAGQVQNSGGLIAMLVYILMEVRGVRRDLNRTRKDLHIHEEKFVHTDRRAANPLGGYESWPE